MEDFHRIGKFNNGSKMTIIRFINRKSCKKVLLNRKQLGTLNYSKRHLDSGTKVFINENLIIRNELLAFNCRLLKRKKQVYVTFTIMVWYIQAKWKRKTTALYQYQHSSELYNVCDKTRENQKI